MSAVACLLCLCCCTVIQPTGCQIKIKICSLWYSLVIPQWYSLVIPQFSTQVLKPICSTNLILHKPPVPSGLLFTGTGLGWDLLRIIFCALVFTLIFLLFLVSCGRPTRSHECDFSACPTVSQVSRLVSIHCR